MGDELETLSEEIRQCALRLRDFGVRIRSKGSGEPTLEERYSLYEDARPLARNLEDAQREIKDVVRRSEQAMVGASEIDALRDAHLALSGALGGLYASMEFLKDEDLHAADRTFRSSGDAFVRDARELPDIAVRLERVRGMKSPKRFAVGTSVRIRMPGVDGVVTQLDSERTVLSEYWHTVKTDRGERREPGSNLEIIDPPIAHTPDVPKIADTIHFHGHNSRLTVGGNDYSTNTVELDVNELFAKLRHLAGSIASDEDQQVIMSRIENLEAAQNSSGFIPAYQAFMASLSDHITVFTPLLPALALLLGHQSS